MIQPYYDKDGIVIYHGDCRDVLPMLESGIVDLVLTDPPYGVNKRHRTYASSAGPVSEWDGEFPLWWCDAAASLVPVVAVMPGVVNLPKLPSSMGYLHYRWTIAAHLVNGMTRGEFGYGNWMPCSVYAAEGVSLYQQKSDVGRVVVGREPKPNHPSPKPLEAVQWFLKMLPGNSILDPFMGSGTTLLAAKGCGLRGVGIEIEESYCELAARRLSQGVFPEFNATGG